MEITDLCHLGRYGWSRGGGYWSSVCYSLLHWNTHHHVTSFKLIINFIFGRCQHSCAVVTPVKYGVDSKVCIIWRNSIHNREISEWSLSDPHPLASVWCVSPHQILLVVAETVQNMSSENYWLVWPQDAEITLCIYHWPLRVCLTFKVLQCIIRFHWPL